MSSTYHPSLAHHFVINPQQTNPNRSDLDKLEELYNSLSDKIDAKHKQSTQDHDQWTSTHDQLQKHIQDLKDALNKSQQSQQDNLQNQIDAENKKRDEINNKQKEKVNKLKKEISDLKNELNEAKKQISDIDKEKEAEASKPKPAAYDPLSDPNNILSKNPYPDLGKFLDDVEKLNKDNQNEWDKTKQRQQDEIKKVLDMLEDPSKWPAFPQQVK